MFEVRQKSVWRSFFGLQLASILTVAAISQLASAATLCVSPGGSGGCFAKINDAIAAAKNNDTIQVASGTYAEDVVIGKALSLVGNGAPSTVIDAKGLPNGIYVDGMDHHGLSDVAISGFTVQNANFEGILVTNASSVTVFDSRVRQNDQNLSVQDATCPGLPSWETAEGFDCGEGIHFSGVDHSTVAGTVVENNAGGILISDDSGASYKNLISHNTVARNGYDCGITLASHPPSTGATSPLGVFHNTIADNTSTQNGLKVHEGAGVGIFASVPGAKAYGNVVIHNRLTNNGLPGVAMHSHSPNQNLNNTMIIGNHISGNGADTDDAATPGPTGINVFGVSPIRGTVISQNVIDNEAYDVVTNTPAQVDANLNDLLGGQVGLDNLGSGKVNATQNWWGCTAGPGAAGCSTVTGSTVSFIPWLSAAF